MFIISKTLKSLGSFIFSITIIFLIYKQAFAEVNYTFSAFVAVENEYDDNIFQDRSRKCDLITTIYPGLNLSLINPRGSLELIYSPGITEYRDHHELDYVSQNFSIAGNYSITEHLTLNFTDDYLRTDDPRIDEIIDFEETEILREFRTSLRSTRNRNTFQPRLTYQFGAENFLIIKYRNSIYKDEDPTEDDFVEHFLSSELIYWLNKRNGITIGYEYESGDFDVDSDLESNTINGRYTYRFTPHFELFGEYEFETTHFEEENLQENDFDLHETNLGFQYQFSPHVFFTGYAGYYLKKESKRDDEDGPNFLLGTTIYREHLTFNLRVRGGYLRDYFSGDDSGDSEYWGVESEISYALSQNLRLNARGSYYNRDFSKGDKRGRAGRDNVNEDEENNYRLVSSIIYDFAKFASLEIRYIHEERDSDDPNDYYIDNRIMAMITFYKDWSNTRVTASPYVRRHRQIEGRQ